MRELIYVIYTPRDTQKCTLDEFMLHGNPIFAINSTCRLFALLKEEEERG